MHWSTSHHPPRPDASEAEDQTTKVGTFWEARREARAAADAHRAEVERAKREGDWLRHAVEELNKLSPQAGEETALAERRTEMMQAEKVAEDLREAHEVVAGASSSVPALSGVIRRLERRAAQAPGLVEPTVKSLDAALTALDEVRGHLETALRTADFDPADLERIEERLFALRAAGRKYHVPVDELAALARKYNGDIALIDAGEGKLKALEATAEQAEASCRNAAQTLSRARHKAAAALDREVTGDHRSSWSGRSFRRKSTATRPPLDRTASTGRNSGSRPILARDRAR